jgi:hypothetical protein
MGPRIVWQLYLVFEFKSTFFRTIILCFHLLIFVFNNIVKYIYIYISFYSLSSLSLHPDSAQIVDEARSQATISNGAARRGSKEVNSLSLQFLQLTQLGFWSLFFYFFRFIRSVGCCGFAASSTTTVLKDMRLQKSWDKFEVLLSQEMGAKAVIFSPIQLFAVCCGCYGFCQGLLVVVLGYEFAIGGWFW